MPGGWKNNYLRYKDLFLNVLRVYRSRPDVMSFLEIILSLSATIVFSLFAIKPTIQTIISLNKEIKNKEEVLSILKQKVSNLQKASLILQQQASNLTFVEQAVPSKPSVEVAAGQIQGSATNSSAEILTLSSTEVLLYGEKGKGKEKTEKLPENAGEVPVTISATGSYQTLSNFLKTVENLRRPFKIDSFAFSSNQTDAGKVIVMLISGRLPFVQKK